MVFSDINKENGFAFESPVSTMTDTVYKFKQVLLYTTDGGKVWTESDGKPDGGLGDKS